MHKKHIMLALGLAALLTSGCATRIAGTVKLVDHNLQPIASDSPQDIVVNMINTTAALENASHSVKTDETGAFQ